jgi:predicted transcriptional regulator
MDEERLKDAFRRVKEDISNLTYQIELLTNEIYEIKRTSLQKIMSDRQTDRQKNQTVPQEVEGLKLSNSKVSIGNQGVQTDKQTNRQTDKQSKKFALSSDSSNQVEDKVSRIDKVAEVLDSLDSLKKDLRSKFKKLTTQEMIVFSTLYQLSEEGFTVDYPLVASKTNLSESSIRDYVQKLIRKGIPVDKKKENNKKVVLSIPLEFKRMASLQTILSLREI